MDFRFSDDEEALRSLAATVAADHADAPLKFWAAATSAGLPGAGLDAPTGAGMGLIGTCLILEEIGRRVVPSPFWSTACVAGLTLDRFGPESLRQEWLPAICDGSAVIAVAIADPADGGWFDPVTASPGPAGGWTLSGSAAAVAYAAEADRLMVAGRSPDGQTLLCVVDPGATGLQVDDAVATDGQPLGRVTFDGVAVPTRSVVGSGAGEAARYAYQVGLAGLCATMSGVLAGGLELTAGYIGQRQQFGRPIAAFQGPAMRVADAYIDGQAVWMAAWSAIWKLHHGRSADVALDIAKYWAADGGHRAVHAFQHLHGGMGVDTDYPIHRYLTWFKRLELTLGGGTAHLERLGRALAAGE